jgi:hypothetical protein
MSDFFVVSDTKQFVLQSQQNEWETYTIIFFFKNNTIISISFYGMDEVYFIPELKLTKNRKNKKNIEMYDDFTISFVDEDKITLLHNNDVVLSLLC